MTFIPEHNMTHSVQLIRPMGHERSRRALISDSRGILMTMFPNYGVAYSGHRMNEVWATLQNLTSRVLELNGLIQNNPETMAMKEMLLQNRVALDIVLAKEGGVCAIIGQQCCTYIPDTRDNFTVIHDKLTTLKNQLEGKEDSDTLMSFLQFDPLGWIINGTWWQILLKCLTPVIVILILFCLFTMCVIPCLRSMIAKMASAAFVQMAIVAVQTQPRTHYTGQIHEQLPISDSEKENDNDSTVEDDDHDVV